LTLAFLDSIGLNLTFCRGIARAAPGIIVPEDSPPRGYQAGRHRARHRLRDHCGTQQLKLPDNLQ
jgi:hypothetical protein